MRENCYWAQDCANVAICTLNILPCQLVNESLCEYVKDDVDMDKEDSINEE